MMHTARNLPKLGLWRLVQLRQRYPASTRVSFVEGDAACAKLHKANQSASSIGKLYSGVLAVFLLFRTQEGTYSTLGECVERLC